MPVNGEQLQTLDASNELVVAGLRLRLVSIESVIVKHFKTERARCVLHAYHVYATKPGQMGRAPI